MLLLYWARYACIKPVYNTRCFSAWAQSSESNPIIQIKRSNGIFELQTCIRTTSFFQNFWTPYVQPIVIVCKQVQITKWVLIRVPLWSFTWTGAHVSCGWNLECLGEWRVCPWTFPRLLQGIWHCKSRYFVRKIRVSRHPWYSTDVV